MKKYFAILIIALVILAGCGGNKEKMDSDTQQKNESNEQNNKGVKVNVNVSADKKSNEETEAPKRETGTSQAQEVVVAVKATGPSTEVWEFTPSEIKVKQGQLVKLVITVPENDVAHGFALPAFGVNQRLEPGVTTTVEFVADKKGEFDFRCSVSCGSGHSGMKGKVIVE